MKVDQKEMLIDAGVIMDSTCMSFCRSAVPAPGIMMPGIWLPKFEGRFVPLDTGSWKLLENFGSPPDFAAAAIKRDCCCANIVSCC